MEFIKDIPIVTGGRWAPSRVDVTRIEKAFRSVNDSELIAIAAVLHCEPNWLLIGDSPALEGVRDVVRSWQKQKTTENEDKKAVSGDEPENMSPNL